jgi:hypothetical protein
VIGRADGAADRPGERRHHGWGFAESSAALCLLAALRARQAEEAAHALASLLPVNQRFLPVSKVLVRWATAAVKRRFVGPLILRDAYADLSRPRLA